MRNLKRLRSARVISTAARVRTEPPATPLRTQHGYRPTLPAHRNLCRTPLRHL